MSGDSLELVRKARSMLAAATPGPWECYSLTRNGVGYGVGRKTPSGDDEGLCEDRYLLLNDAELIAAAPELLAALCNALESAEAKAARMFARICAGCYGHGLAHLDGGSPPCAACGGSGAVIVEGAK